MGEILATDEACECEGVIGHISFDAEHHCIFERKSVSDICGWTPCRSPKNLLC